MPVFYLAANRPRAGKTALACALARRLSAEGHAVTVVKALSTTPQVDPDVAVYRSLLGQDPDTELPLGVLPDQIGPSLPSALVEDLQRATGRLQERYELILVEGLSSLAPREMEAQASAALARALGAVTILVAGFLPDLRPEELVEGAHLFDQRLVGAVINGVPRYRQRQVQEELVPALAEADMPLLGWLPEDRTLLGVTVGEVARHLGGQFLSGEEGADELVEHLLLGALVLDSGVGYFEQATHKAVLVRGDRPDIQMAALHTATACLVLTGGATPLQYVRYEAREQGVPLIQVPQSTLEAAAQLDELVLRVRFNHPSKLDRMTALVESHLNLSALSAALAR